MPCYVRFRSIQEMLDDGTIRRDDLDYLYDDVARNSIPERMEHYFNGDYYLIDCDPFSNSFCYGSYTFYKRWVAEWSLNGITPIREEPQRPTVAEPTISRRSLRNPDPLDTDEELITEDVADYKRKKKKPIAPPAPTRTLTLQAMPVSEMDCSWCFYKGMKGCFTSECKRRYWKLIESVDKP